MSKTKVGTEYVCEVCGTTLLVTESGVGYLDEIVCCSAPMKAKSAKKTKSTKKKGKPKKKK
jgi:hypothetical protein